MRLPAERHGAIFDDVGINALVALNRRLDQRGIDDLLAARYLAVLVQLLLDLLEELVTDAGLGQAVTEQFSPKLIWFESVSVVNDGLQLVYFLSKFCNFRK